MSAPYTLVLVGGTGQRIGIALGYLNVLGLASVPRRVIVIDADDQFQSKLTQLLSFGGGCEVNYLRPFAANEGRGHELSAIVSSSGSKFWDACVEPDDRDMSVKQGFFARPQLASVLFTHGLAHPSRFPLLGKLKSVAAAGAAQDSTIVVAGSISGGTGAGVIPTLARELRAHGWANVVGLLFSRYFEVPPPEEGKKNWAPDNDLLRANADAGFEHIRELLTDPVRSPFQAVYALGHSSATTLPRATDQSVFELHSFPGFLLAAGLLADGARGIDARIGAAQKDGNTTPQLYVFPCGQGGEVPQHSIPVCRPANGLPGEGLRGTDNMASDVSASALADLLAPASDAVQDFASMPLRRSIGRAALFARRRLGAALFDTMDKMKLLRGDELSNLSSAVGAAAETHREVVQKVRSHLTALGDHGVTPRGGPSPAVRPRSWRQILQVQAGVEFPVDMAQRWVQAVSRGQLSDDVQDLPEPSITGPDYLLPYTVTHPRAATACVPVQVSPSTVSVDHGNFSNWARLSRSFARPDGRAQAFGLAVVSGVGGAKAVAWLLWRALAAGQLAIEPVDCGRAPDDSFDYTLARATGERFHLRLFESSKPELTLGGLSADWGLWPAPDSADVRAAHKRVESALNGPAWELGALPSVLNQSRSLRGALVLHRWLSELTGASGTPPRIAARPWFRELRSEVGAFLAGAGVGPGGAIDEDGAAAHLGDHLRSSGPLETSEEDGARPVFVYQFDGWRRSRIRLLQRGLVHGPLNVQNTKIVDPTMGQAVASFGPVPLALAGGGHTVEPHQILASGFCDVRFEGPLPVGDTAGRPSNPPGEWLQLLQLPGTAAAAAQAGWLAQSVPAPVTSPFAPDLFWNA